MAYNLIFYFSDQQRWDTCGCYGQPLDITPNLDALAAEGVRFDNAFSPQPVCGPCRALFQTGKYPTETGCFRNNVMLPSHVKTLGSYMEQDAHYETAYIGKWHLDGGDYFGYGKCPEGWDPEYWYDMKCYLNELTARTTGLPVFAGPTEGTALGNLMAQFIAAGEFDDLEAARAAIRQSFDIKEVTP